MRKQRGITLVALIITVIILLILATVSISLLINGGIIGRADKSVKAYSEAEIGEQIKLAYLECQTEKLSNSNVDEKVFIENSLREKLNDSNLIVKVKEGKLTVKTTIKGEPKTYIYQSSTGESYEYIDIIDYKGKEKKDLVRGDDITLGTEKFRVFYNKDGEIKAMAFYNLKLDSNQMRQATEEEATNEQEGRVTFSDSVFWEKGEYIDMLKRKDDNSGYKNNVQQYIDGYEKTIEKLGQKGIEVRVPTRR